MNEVEHRNLIDLAEHPALRFTERLTIDRLIADRKYVRLTDLDIALVSAIRSRIARSALERSPEPPDAA